MHALGGPTTPSSAVVSPPSRRVMSRHTDVAALNGGLGGTEPKADVLVPSPATLAGPRGLDLGLGVLEDVRLLLESPLGLNSELGRHGVGCGRWLIWRAKGKLSGSVDGEGRRSREVRGPRASKICCGCGWLVTQSD